MNIGQMCTYSKDEGMLMKIVMEWLTKNIEHFDASYGILNKNMYLAQFDIEFALSHSQHTANSPLVRGDGMWHAIVAQIRNNKLFFKQVVVHPVVVMHACIILTSYKRALAPAEPSITDLTA